MIPSEEYIHRRDDRKSRVGSLQQIHIRLGNVRLAVAAIFVVIAWASLRIHRLSPWWLLLPIATFAAIAVYHSRILRDRNLAERAVSFYAKGLARIEDRWAGVGETGERFDDPHHVYASDLDLFGEGNLFQLLSAARTRMGEETLANWLLSPATLEGLRERHAAISELGNDLDLREDLAVLGEDARAGVHPDALVKWAESPNQMKPLAIAWLSPILAALAILGAVAWAVWGIVTPFVIVIVVEAVLTFRLRKRLDEVLNGTELAFRDLDLLSGVLARAESQTFRAPKLRALRSELLSSGIPSSGAIERLRRLVELIDARHNVFVRLIDAPLLYSIQVAFAAERWRRAHGAVVRRWVSAIGEMEALVSLAAYSFEHPSDSFPQFVEGSPSFEAEGLGHPLIPAVSCVRNDVRLAGETRILLVSGSNMSGKSTLLRAIGMNVVLAMAGAPVRARRLQLRQLQIGASIRINDSLREGSSRFYAEIKRLRQIYEMAGSGPPLLFLLDELLQGTNSKDRRIGAEGILRALVKRGAIGLVSTHDLALADIEEAAEGHLQNVHFQDEFANGKITFDYKLRDGVVTKSNGLELMRSIGLDV